MSETPLAIGNIVNLMTNNSKLKPLLHEYEAELQEFQRLSAANEQMRERLNSLTIDHMLVNEAIITMNEQRDEHKKASEIIELCYSQALKIENLLKNEKFNNISKYTMLIKQNEAKAMLESLESKNMSEMDNMAILESRHIVMQLRHLQCALDSSEQEMKLVKQSAKDFQYRKRMTLEWATGQLNKKILNLLIKRNELMELQKELSRSKAQKTMQYQTTLAQDPSVSMNISAHQSALDFLKNFSNGTINKKAVQSKANNNSEETALRSILVAESNRSTPSPHKQVRFAPSPLTEEEDDNMTDNDNWDALVEQMEVNFANLEQLPSTLESAIVISTNSTDKIMETDLNSTTSLNASAYGQSSISLVTSCEIITNTSRNEFATVGASTLIPAPPLDTFAGHNRFGSSAIASDSIATTSQTVFNLETHNTDNQSGLSASEDTMSDDQDDSGSAMLFSASKDDFFLNFSDEMNGKSNDDYEL